MFRPSIAGSLLNLSEANAALLCWVLLLSCAWLVGCEKTMITQQSSSVLLEGAGPGGKELSSISSPQRQSEQHNSVGEDAIETSISFSGWKGEAAVLRQEEIFEDGRMRTRFFAVTSDGRRQALDPEAWQDAETEDPPEDLTDLQEGKLLISDFSTKHPFPNIDLQIHANAKEVRALERAILDWSPEKKIPSAKAILDIQLQVSKQSHALSIWVEESALRPYMGEAGLEYRPPAIKLAVLSPSEETIFVLVDYGMELDALTLRFPKVRREGP